MKILRLLAVFFAFSSIANAVDTTPPTLDITHTWIEKRPYYDGKTYSWFSMYLDPRDETGMAVDNILFRSALNTSTIPANQPWQWMPWTRGERFEIGFICSSCVIEIRARDAAGNLSAVQKRVFTSPFPYTTAPNTKIQMQLSGARSQTGPALDCKGLFAGKLDDTGSGDDILQVDRTTGNVTARRQEPGSWSVEVVASVSPDTIEDSAAADVDGNGKLDFVLLVNGGLRLFLNSGLDGNLLTYTEVTLNPAALNGMNLTTITNVAFGDISGEGRPEIIVSGTDGSGNVRIAWLDNNAIYRFLSANHALAPTGTGSGRVAVGDVTGDGFNDVVMVDPVGKQLILFKNDAGARLGGDDDVVSNKRPVATSTGGNFGGLEAKALALGDVTGDGRADAVVVLHFWGSTNQFDSNDTHNYEYWQLLDSWGTSGFHAGSMQPLSAGPFSASEEDFTSDVLVRDLTGDRFPELVFTSHFTADLVPDDDPIGHPELIPSRDPGVRVLQLAPILTTNNLLNYYNITKVERIDTNTMNPHRLALPRYGANKVPDIAVASTDATTSLPWIANVYRESTALVSIEGGTATDTDQDGTEIANGQRTYTVYPNGLIEYTLTITNNTAVPLTNAIFDSLLPPTVAAEDLDGGSLIASGTSKLIRWTETIPANASINKHFTARLLPTAAVGTTIIQPKNTLKYGTTTLTSTMPKVTLDEPITFALLSMNSETDPTGATVHYGEGITYRMRLTNRGKTPINNTIIGMSIPTGSIFDGPVSPVPGTTQVLSSGNKRIDITVTTVGPETYQDVFVNVEARGADNSIITNSTMTAQRPSGTKRTLAAVKTTILPAIDVQWYSVHSEFSPRNQTGGEPLIGTQVHYGEIIRYRPKLINRSSIAQLNVTLKIPVPTGCVFDGPVSAIPGMTYTTPSNTSIIYTIASIPGSTYHPDGSLNTLSINTNARLDVECRAADYANVVQSATTVQVPGRAIVNPGTYTFVCRPALEIDVKTLPTMTNVRPGATITYELQATNWGSNKVTSGKVINRIPQGTKLHSALADDGTGTTTPFSSGDFIGTAQFPHELSATSKPAYILNDLLLVWEVGEVLPGETKTMRYAVTVAADLANAYFTNGLSNPLAMMNTNYNFVGTANTGKRIFAFVPISPTSAAPANAAPFWMNSADGKAPAINVEINTNAPLPKPKLQVVKHVVGPRNEALPEKYDRLPTDQALVDVAPNIKKNDWMFYVENDTSVPNDAICNYTLHYFNTGGAPATNVRVKDVIPTGMTFVGFLAKDQVLVSSFAFSKFYDAAGKLLDLNNSANVTKVRSFDLYGGNLAIKESHAFTYQCVATDSLAVGTVITSKRGGKSGVAQGLNYTALAGYHLTADELHFPVDGSPDAVHVKITAKAGFILPIKDGWKSGHGMADSASAPPPAPVAFGAAPPPPSVSEDDSESITISMPYDVRGDAGAAPLPPLSNVKMSFLLPKGYKTDDAYVNSVNNVKLKTLNTGAVVEGNSYVSAIRQADGRIKVTFPLDDIPFAWPTAHIIYDPLYKNTLVDSKTGYTKSGADIEVNLTGFYGGGGGSVYDATADAATDTVTTTKAHGCVPGNWVQFNTLSGGIGLTTGTPYVVVSAPTTSKLTLAEEVGGTLIDITGNATTGTKLQRLPEKAIPPVKSFIHIDSRADADKDTKVFIGRCAPVSVKRGDTFTYTIFVGSLSSTRLGSGLITMKVPTGCVALSAKRFAFNGVAHPISGSPFESGGFIGNVLPNTGGTYLPAGSTFINFREYAWTTPKPAGTLITWETGDAFLDSEGGAVQLTCKVLENFTGNHIDDNTCLFDVVNAMPKSPGPNSIVVREGDVDGQAGEILQRYLHGTRFKHNTGTTNEINKTLMLDENTCGISIGGADVLQFLNGVNLIPLPNNRVMLLGPPDNVIDAAGGTLVLRTLINDPMMRITCGFGTSGAASLVNIPGYTGVTPANQILSDLGVPGLNVLASKIANVLIGGGNNLVRSGSGTFAGAGLNGANGPALLLPNAQALLISDLKNAGDAKLIGQDGASVVSGGAGSAATGTGGQILAPGSAGLIGQDGASVVANDGAGLIGQDGASVVANDGAGVVANDGAGLIGQDGASLIGQDGASLIGLGGSTLTGVNTGTGK